MSITPIKVRIVKRPIIKARFVPQLPANLTGRTAISVERNGSIYYLDLDYSKLAESLSFDPAQNVVAILRSDGVWHKTTVATLSTMIGADKPNLVAIANAATSADKLGYWSGPAQYSLTDFTAYMRTLLDDPDATTARATLGLVIGTDVQPHDAELDALAGLVSAADRLPYFTGPGTAALAVLTPFARTLLDDADAAAMRTTIDAQQHDTDLDAIAALTPTDDDFIQRKAGAWVNRSIAQVKTDLAINNVDNTSDLNKPISTATQGALDLKADKATTVSAGTGLTGGGDLSANRSVALSSASIASLGKADTAVQPARAVNSGTGLTGGGDLSVDRTIALDAASQASLAKADTAVQPGALATVATTGAYSDLTGKPYTVPVGGVAGQVLAKKTSADGDTEWITGGGGGGGGDMLASMYDPTGVAGDAFDVANMHGWGASTAVALGGNTVRFNTRALALASAELPVEIKNVWLDGYGAFGDAPPALYRLVATEPAHEGKIQIGTRWYELANDTIELKQFDDFSAGIGSISATTAFNRALSFMKYKSVKLLVRGGVFNFASAPNKIDFPVHIEFADKQTAFYRDYTAAAGNNGLIHLTNSANGTASNSILRNVHIRATATSSSGAGISLFPVNTTFGFGNIVIDNATISCNGTDNWYTSLFCYGLQQNAGALGIRSCMIDAQVFGAQNGAANFIGVKHSYIRLQANTAGGSSGNVLFDGDSTVSSGDIRLDASSLEGVTISNNCSQIVVTCAQCSGNFSANTAVGISLFGNCSGTVSSNVKWFQR